ncbi:MAG: bactofilin family protein [Treponemataceae bacterium]
MHKTDGNDLLDFDEEDFDTVMADDISFTGTIRFDKPFMIKGNISGVIDATSDLVIDTKATVSADITATRVLVRGSVKGNIQAGVIVHVMPSGSVAGDILSNQVVLEHGCFFSGKCSMNQRV